MSELRHAVVHLSAPWGDMWILSMGTSDEEAIRFAKETAPWMQNHEGFTWSRAATAYGAANSETVIGIVTWWGPPYEGGKYSARMLNAQFIAATKGGGA